MKSSHLEKHPYFNILPFTKICRNFDEHLVGAHNNRFWFSALQNLTIAEQKKMYTFFHNTQPNRILIEECDAHAVQCIAKICASKGSIKTVILSKLNLEATDAAMKMLRITNSNGLYLIEMDAFSAQRVAKNLSGTQVSHLYFHDCSKDATLAALEVIDHSEVVLVTLYRYGAIAARAVEQHLKNTNVAILFCGATKKAVKEFTDFAIAEHERNVTGKSYKRVIERIDTSNQLLKKQAIEPHSIDINPSQTQTLANTVTQQQKQLLALEEKLSEVTSLATKQTCLLEQQQALLASMVQTLSERDGRITLQSQMIYRLTNGLKESVEAEGHECVDFKSKKL